MSYSKRMSGSEPTTYNTTNRYFQPWPQPIDGQKSRHSRTLKCFRIDLQRKNISPPRRPNGKPERQRKAECNVTPREIDSLGGAFAHALPERTSHTRVLNKGQSWDFQSRGSKLMRRKPSQHQCWSSNNSY